MIIITVIFFALDHGTAQSKIPHHPTPYHNITQHITTQQTAFSTSCTQYLGKRGWIEAALNMSIVSGMFALRLWRGEGGTPTIVCWVGGGGCGGMS